MEKIRTLNAQNGGRIPALALTGYASASDASKAFAAGYQADLAKPVAPEKLAAAVAKLANRR